VTRSARAFHRHAEAVLDHELHHVRGRLALLPAERRLEVEEVSARVAAALVDGVLAQARAEPALAQALVSIYGHEPVWEPRAVLWVAD
jgi:hypothetical protein